MSDDLRTVAVPREELERFSQTDLALDELVAEGERTLVFRKTLRADDPGIAEQRATPTWPHHLAGDFVIRLTGEAAVVAVRWLGLVADDWRGHGVRIRDARFSASVLVGETVFVQVDVARARRIRESMHVAYRFRMWKLGPSGEEIVTYRSEQDAIFFPGAP